MEGKKFIGSIEEGNIVKVYSHEDLIQSSINSGVIIPRKFTGTKFGRVIHIGTGKRIKTHKDKLTIYERQIVYLEEIKEVPEEEIDFFLPYYKCKILSSLQQDIDHYQKIVDTLKKEQRELIELITKFESKLLTDGTTNN